MSELVSLEVTTRQGSHVATIRVSPKASVEDLKASLYNAKGRAGKYSPERQRLTLPGASASLSGVALDAGKSLEDYDLTNGSRICYKDLGMQIGYKGVFFLEYLGPLLIYPYFWTVTGRRGVHGLDTSSHRTELVQDLAMVFWSFHYFKRIYETFHVHKFSHATMPVSNLFRNCGYYYLFAAFVSYNINHPKIMKPPMWVTLVAFSCAYLCEIGNYISHLSLAQLRSKSKSSGYSIPLGGLFDYVTCANYTFEIWAWVLFAVGTQSLPAALFCAAGAFQMVQWAIAKHRRLRKLYDGKDGREKFSRRWIVLPPFL